MFFTKSEELLIGELKNAGFIYEGINDLFNQKQLPLEVVKIILKSFEEVYKEHLGSGDHLIRSLISSAEPFDPTPLINFFERNIYNKSVMWSVGFVIARAKTYEISKWLKQQLLSENAAFQRAGLVYGLRDKGNFSSLEECKEFLQKIFTKYPFGVLEVYQKIGSKDDINFLESQKTLVSVDVSKEIEKVVKKLTKK